MTWWMWAADPPAPLIDADLIKLIVSAALAGGIGYGVNRRTKRSARDADDSDDPRGELIDTLKQQVADLKVEVAELREELRQERRERVADNRRHQREMADMRAAQ